VEPVIAGLDKENRPFICSHDLIGCINFAKDFVVSGTTSNQLFGMCESLWEPNLVCDVEHQTIEAVFVNQP
jgi:20S proteasome subunit beta 3